MRPKFKFLSRYIGHGGSFPNQQMAQSWYNRFWHPSILFNLYVLIGYLCIVSTYHSYNDVVDQSEKRRVFSLLIQSNYAIKGIAQLYKK